MPLPAVVQTTARVAKLIKPTLLSVFLETRHCRRMSTGKYGTGAPSPRSSDEVHTRQTLTTWNANVGRPGGKRRNSEMEEEERLEDGLNKLSSSTVINSRIQPSSKQKKQRVERKFTFVEEPKSPLQFSNSSSSDQVEREGALSSQATGSLPPQTSSSKPTFIDEEDRYDEVFRQLPNPPFPKSPFSPHPSAEGISGRAAAIAYLRIRGLANRGRKKTFFSLLAWVLRHAARDLGFEIVPDGFVRISDLVGLFSRSPSYREGS